MYSEEILIYSRSRQLLPAQNRQHFFARPEKIVNPFRLLLVDDDAAIRQVVAQMLDVLGYVVDTAEDGVKALDCLSSSSYDLVLTDLEMPVMDGYRLAVQIRNCSLDTKIVIMTGRCPEDLAELMASQQVDAWLFKPFGLSEIRYLLDGFAFP